MPAAACDQSLLLFDSSFVHLLVCLCVHSCFYCLLAYMCTCVVSLLGACFRVFLICLYLDLLNRLFVVALALAHALACASWLFGLGWIELIGSVRLD